MLLRPVTFGFERGARMKLQSELAHSLVEQFVAWNQATGKGPRGYRRESPYVIGKRRSSRLKPYFCDEHADLADVLLQSLEARRPREHEVLMYYYEHKQSQAATARRFGLHPSAVDTLVNTALGYLDGQLDVLQREEN